MLKVKPNLTPLLKKKGIIQMELSEMTGIPQGSISRFDKNSRHEAWHLFAIAKALDVTIEDLFIAEEHED